MAGDDGPYTAKWRKMYDGGALVPEGQTYIVAEDTIVMTAEQQQIRQALLTQLNAWREKEGHTPSENEIAWLTDACVVRYLRARSWHIEKALELLIGSIKWRQEYQPWIASPRMDRELLRREAASRKMYIAGRDRSGRPIVVMRPARDDTGDEDAEWKVRYLVWVTERVIAAMDEQRGVEKMVWLIEMSGMKVAMTHSMSITKECINNMQNHYVERLGKAFFINAPWLFNALWRVIGPFLDPNTKAKVSFIKTNKAGLDELHAMIDPSNLEEDLNGTFNFDFDLDRWVANGTYSSSELIEASEVPSAQPVE